MQSRTVRSYGWKPQLPDFRDHQFDHTRLKIVSLPKSADLRKGMPLVYDQGDLGSCHDAETEVLTDLGWRLFSELNGSERLATVDSNTSTLIFESPTRLIRFPYSGTMICADNESLNFKVTPDHKMLVRSWNQADCTLNTEYKQIPASEIGWYCGLMNRVKYSGEITSCDVFTMPGVDHRTRDEQRHPKNVSMSSWLKFLGIYLAEGTMLKEEGHFKIQIAAFKEREKDFFRALLPDLGVHALELPDRFTFNDKQIYTALELLGLRGVKAGNKFVPPFVFRLSNEKIKAFLEGHFAGDGSEQNGHRVHYTGSRRLADDLQALIFLSGDETRMSIRSPRESVTKDGRKIIGTLDEHRVSVCEIKNLSIERKETIFREEYDGDVFCAEVPSFHTLVTRRHGKILISGNCTANMGAGMFEYCLIKEGLTTWVPSRLFIYYNERVIDGDVTQDTGAQCRDALTVMAKQGVCAETEWPYDVTKFAVKPTDQCYTDAKNSIALEYLAVDQTLVAVKTVLAGGFPVGFGFTVYDSFESDEVATSGIMPMPGQNESIQGGHAVIRVGYIDNAALPLTLANGHVLSPHASGGYYIVRNSWGLLWGDSGYFYAPYGIDTFSSDFWVLQKVN